ncbi:MAG: hypothetical protein EBY03_03320 [Actinobacteria bacterium]|nr:hypothetical protein [Actinomycetota bacterium]NDH81034.1 hypothetical protein [Actinomycetota bacterium]NDH99236.1 hypothetical protein [Actinomycetota bacterium]
MFLSNVRPENHIQRVIRAKIIRTVKGLKNESGSVESTLVLIPLLILFLISMQIGVAINFRNIDRTFAQSEASDRAISGKYLPEDEVLRINPFASFNSLVVLVSKKKSNIPILLPFLGNFLNRGNQTDVTGIAIVETLS